MLYLNGSATNGETLVATWDYWDDPQTKWKVIPSGTGEYHLVSGPEHRVTNKMLYLNGSARVATWDYWDDPQTKWKLIPASASTTSTYVIEDDDDNGFARF